MFSLIRLVLFTRWGRYIIAAILLLAALGSGLAAFAVTHIQMKSGTIAALGDVVDSQTNDYQYSQFTLTGDSTTYQFNRANFTPELTNQAFTKGGKVDFWYVQTLFNNPSIVALQLYDAQNSNPTKYTTDDYTHPDDARNRNLIPAVIFLALGLGAVAVAIFAPTASRRPAKPKQPPTRGYGASVLSAGYRPPAPPSERDQPS